MHTEYFHRWMELLVARLEPGERVLARGRAFEPRDALGFDLSTVISGPGCAVVVTERRALWVSRDEGADWLRVDVWTTNERLQHYYLKQGFTYVRTVVLPHNPSGALFQQPSGSRRHTCKRSRV